MLAAPIFLLMCQWPVWEQIVQETRQQGEASRAAKREEISRAAGGLLSLLSGSDDSGDYQQQQQQQEQQKQIVEGVMQGEVEDGHVCKNL